MSLPVKNRCGTGSVVPKSDFLRISENVMEEIDNIIKKKQNHSMNEKIPIYEKVCLTINEAAEYSNIGIKKLHEMTNNPICPFVLHVGEKKKLIKRKEFENFISRTIEI